MTAFLSGHTAAITGGGRGIGAATAVALAQAGVSRVALIARSEDQMQAAAEQVRRTGAAAEIFPVDLLDLAALPNLAAELNTRLGAVDILINNAATVEPLGSSGKISPSAFRDALTLNVVVPAALTAYLVPSMLSKGWGRVVNISSRVAAHPETMIGGNAYATAKSALEAHTINLAAELAGSGVTINVYRPGTVDTSMQEWLRTQDPARVGEQIHTRFAGLHERGMLITPENAGQALVAHLSGEGTGQIWDVSDAL